MNAGQRALVAGLGTRRSAEARRRRSGNSATSATWTRAGGRTAHCRGCSSALCTSGISTVGSRTCENCLCRIPRIAAARPSTVPWSSGATVSCCAAGRSPAPAAPAAAPTRCPTAGDSARSFIAAGAASATAERRTGITGSRSIERLRRDEHSHASLATPAVRERLRLVAREGRADGRLVRAH